MTKSTFEALDFQAKCGELSKNRHDYVYNLVEKDGEWFVDFGDGFEETIEFECTIGDILTPVYSGSYGAFCSECYMDTPHDINTCCCDYCGTPE